MIACPACGAENPEGFDFCGKCTTPLTGPRTGLREERKVVTALFCDLVGFTANAESADPEDVDAMLNRYSAMARAQIEGHGGVVEKFIGDAVVGVFGVPAIHEDDPERAVRAGLRIVEAAEDLQAVAGAPLSLRVGVNTGEVLVRLGVAPGSGERLLAGDAINTASRIQSVAPEMGVAVGQLTYEVTKAVFDYVELPPATVKGKADPLVTFHARAPLARFGTDLTRTHDSPFIGREVDLALLKGNFDKTVAASAPQLVTVVGEPGLGKSRLVAELGAYIDGYPALVTWRQGRCLPYGEGITFWALGEVVKAHAGILDSDQPDVAAAKLEAVLPDGLERPWLRQRLLPLLGIEASSTAEREELFTAWRRFFEHVAETKPTVVVFEDLHWADDAMLAFIEHLADGAEGVPLLIVGTARPELFETHPDYARGLRNATPINLAPLSRSETSRLVSALLDAAVVPAELQAPILDRAGGNPLYAEEYVRLLKDKGLLTRAGSSWQLIDGAEVPFPDSVQALIAARLDTLPPDRKAMLADAAVVGKVFWAGAVAAMGDLVEADVVTAMRELSRKELVRPVRHSSMGGQAEYAFWHVLARDVAYGQLPRATRAARHVAAAEWIEAQAAGRVEDLADVLAHHYATAVDLTTAAGDLDQAALLQPEAVRFLTLAGERALGLDTAAALTNLRRALELTPVGRPARARVLAGYGRAAFHAGQLDDAEPCLQEAVELSRNSGDAHLAVHCLLTLAALLQLRADSRWARQPAEAIALLEPLPPGPDLVEALIEQARANAIHDLRGETAIAHANRALELADQLGVERPARALGYRAVARILIGDADGLSDYRDAIELASTAGQGYEAAVLQNNYANDLVAFEGPAASLAVYRAGIDYARERGLAEIADWMIAASISMCFLTGRLDEVFAGVEQIAPVLEATGNWASLGDVSADQTWALTLQGRADEAGPWLRWLDSSDAGPPDPQMLVVMRGAAALAYAELGDPNRVATLLTEITDSDGARELAQYAQYLPAMVRTAVGIGRLPLAERLTGDVPSRTPYGEHSGVMARATLAEAHGDLAGACAGFADAAERWHTFGVPVDEGFALLGQGRCLLALGRPSRATPVLHRAREIFERLNARPALTQTDSLLAHCTALSS